MAEKNKVEFGLENVHYGSITYDELTGKANYGTPKRWNGAVELTLDIAGDPTTFKADNIDYWTNQNNQGYSGTFTSALIPDDFAVSHLGEVKDTDETIVEYGTSQSTPFYLMFQFEGDKNAVRHIMYHCVATRPPFGSKTKDGGDVNTRALSFKSSPRPQDKQVKRKCASNLKEIYDAWFTKVYEGPEIGG